MALKAYVNGKREKSPRKSGDTLRFELELALPTDDSTNEFSYAHLVADAENKRRGLQPDPGTSEDGTGDKLGAIARQLEEKYGPKGRKRVIHESDLVDKGYGYDTNDPFVDDTELYEDYVPPQVDTQFGGFYVNTGELEFRKAEEVDDDDFDFGVRKKPKLMKQPTPQAIVANQKLKKAKQHVASQKTPKKPAKSIKNLLSAPGAGPHVKQASKPSKLSTKKLPPSGNGVAGSSLDQAPSSAAVSSLLPSSSANPSVPISIGGVSLAVPLFDSPDSSSATKQSNLTNQAQAAVQKLSMTEEGSAPPVAPKPSPTLPSGLPDELQKKIAVLEEDVAKIQRTEGKVTIKARESIDELLADIEICCKSVSLRNRTATMDYLSHKLGVAKGTLFRRSKQVLRKREDVSLKEPLQKLKDAVEASMPEQIAQYEEEVKSKARVESTSSLSDKDIKMEVDEDNRIDDVFEDSQLPSTSQPDAKAKRPPRKKYKWNDEIRKLLCDVVRVKVETEGVINRISRVNPEELITQFLEDKVKSVWPKGWMQKGILYKVSEPVHRSFTSPSPKKAKKEKVATVKTEPGAASALPATAPVALKPPPGAPHSLSATASATSTGPLLSAIKVEQQPKVSLTKVITFSKPGSTQGSGIQSKSTSSVASGTGAYAGKKVLQTSGSVLQSSSKQSTHLSAVVGGSSSPTQLVEVQPKSSVGGQVVKSSISSTKANTIPSMKIPTLTQKDAATTLAASKFDVSKLLDFQRQTSSSQTITILRTATTGMPGEVSSQAKSSIVQPHESSAVHAVPEVAVCHSSIPTSKATGSPPRKSHCPSQTSRATHPLTAKVHKQVHSPATMAIKTKSSIPSTAMPMPASAGVPSPNLKQTPSPSSSSRSPSTSPSLQKMAAKSHQSVAKPMSPKHHHETIMSKGTPSPKYHPGGKASPPSPRHVQSHSPTPPPGRSTAPPTTLLQHSFPTQKPTISQPLAVTRKTTPSPLAIPTISSPTQSVLLPVVPPLSVASSPGTPPSVQSPVEQIFQEHSYGSSQGHVLQLPHQWTIANTGMAQAQLLVTSPRQSPAGGVAGTVTAGSQQPHILLPVTAHSGASNVGGSSNSGAGLLFITVANNQGNGSPSPHVTIPNTGPNWQ